MFPILSIVIFVNLEQFRNGLVEYTTFQIFFLTMNCLGKIWGCGGDDNEGYCFHTSAEIYQPFTKIYFLLPSSCGFFTSFLVMMSCFLLSPKNWSRNDQITWSRRASWSVLQIITGMIKSKWDGRGIWHIYGRRCVYGVKVREPEERGQ
jgi:hypothetical protein